MLHTELQVWKRSMELVEEVYRLTATLPQSEKYGIISQMNRAAISIPSNIAEGAGRNTLKEYLRFLHIATGSASELETLLQLTKRLGLNDTTLLIKDHLIPVKKMLYKQKQSLKSKL